MENIILLLAIIATCTLGSLVLTPIVIKFAKKYKILDVPKDDRRMHRKPVPLLGGLVIYIVFIVGVVTTQEMNYANVGMILGSTVIMVGGIIDDIKNLRPIEKLIFQIGATIILIMSGVLVENITNPFNSDISYFNIGMLSYPLTFIWIIGVTNSINLIDGLDGLASGISLISTVTILIIAFSKGRIEVLYLSAILSGAILGFLPYNFSPAKIFLGDAGAQLLGFLLSAISIEGAIKSAAAISIAVPILILGLPIFDTVFAIVRRTKNGKSVVIGDRGHLHHRLYDRGLSQAKSVVIMYFISIALGVSGIVAMQINPIASIVLMGSIIIISIFIAWKCGFFYVEYTKSGGNSGKS